MKIKALLAALFVAGFAASFALADPGHGKGGDKEKGRHGGTTQTSTQGSTNGTTTNAPKPKRHCKEVEFQGTAPATTFTVKIDKGNRAARTLGDTATVSFEGHVKVNAVLCSVGQTGQAAAQTLDLRTLKVGKQREDDDD